MDNLRGALLMVLSMAGFAIEDMFIKLTSDVLPVEQIIATLGIGGSLIFATILRLQGRALYSRDMLSVPIVLRGVGEVVGSLSFVTAIALTPISSASAILQATPLAVTLGAALFLGEAVGWRRWSAIGIGFFGVLLIIRPGLEGFNALSLFAVLAVIGLALRDLATRRVPAGISSMQLSFLAFVVLVPSGLLLMLARQTVFVAPSPLHWLYLGSALTVGVFAYYGIVAAMRVGEISFVSPFRYSRLLFAMLIGMVIFAEQPDALTLIGATIIVGSGIYTVWRERKHRARPPASLSKPSMAR
ncbi:DMT family transporter [Sulfitobacter aestuarii]|uniref:DMT family transporter n=1 Tax=Sulfitobacter aestuarii TaxID=2161676 RepID=A0ABW5TZX9_9RHOB